MNRCIIASSSIWRPQIASEVARRTGWECTLITSREELTVVALEKVNPTFVFFPHWSFIIPSEIHDRWECVIFHMTDVPFGRWGSPLQNLIARGIYETKISAIQCVRELDAGAVYLKRPLSLQGTAQDIYIQASKTIEDMIVQILQEHPSPQPQIGDVVRFARRKPEEGNLAKLSSLDQVYDYIRMLDADGYPNAFLETSHFRLEFRRASLESDCVIADVIIKKKSDG